MKVLGIGPPCGHDPAACLLVDGKLVACVEEERFTRVKHASGQIPLNASRFCLNKANLSGNDLDAVAFAWSPEVFLKARWKYARGIFLKNPYQARKAISKAKKINRIKIQIAKDLLNKLRINEDKVKMIFVEHHLAHAASAFYLSGFDEAAIMSIDGSGEYITTLFAEGKEGRMNKIKEFYEPNSLGLFYSAMTEFLGFRANNGEYKLMGMSPYGEASKINLSHIIGLSRKGKHFWVNSIYVKPDPNKCYRQGLFYSRQLVKELGPPREDNDLNEPFIHIAAATQKKLEHITLELLDNYLSAVLKKYKKLCFAGGCALNVRLNRKLLEHPLVEELFVQPASHDAGTSLGAAVLVAQKEGDKIERMKDVYLGPEFDDKEIESILKRKRVVYQKLADVSKTAAELLADGKIVGWFQGKMEFGPRALGNRSILANPAIKGISDTINEKIKFREKWRPFCPSILVEYAEEILDSNHPSPFMTLSFIVAEKWRSRIPEIVHIDGSTRPQIVSPFSNSKFYNLISHFYSKTGIPLVLNTSLNRKGEPIVCSPEDTLNMFYNCGLEYLIIGDFFIHK